jgi:predicted HicB family RNase H-like nuclease
VPNREWTRAKHTMHVRLDPDDKQYVRAKAKREGISISEVVRTYVCWGIETDEKARDKRGRSVEKRA